MAAVPAAMGQLNGLGKKFLDRNQATAIQVSAVNNAETAFAQHAAQGDAFPEPGEWLQVFIVVHIGIPVKSALGTLRRRVGLRKTIGTVGLSVESAHRLIHYASAGSFDCANHANTMAI